MRACDFFNSRILVTISQETIQNMQANVQPKGGGNSQTATNPESIKSQNYLCIISGIIFFSV